MRATVEEGHLVMDQLFIGGKVFDGRGTLLDGHGVMVREGRIAEVAPADRFAGFTGVRVDTTGATLLPGLIDCHVHLVYEGEPNPSVSMMQMGPGQIVMRALANAQMTLAKGTTAIRDCGGKDFLEFAVRDACNSGRQLGPTIMASGKVICMTGGHGNRNGRVADGVDEVIKAVREQIHAGSDLIKIMATGGVMTPGVNPEDAHYSAEEMAAGICEGHRFHRTCASHAQGAEGILNAGRGGVEPVAISRLLVATVTVVGEGVPSSPKPCSLSTWTARRPVSSRMPGTMPSSHSTCTKGTPSEVVCESASSWSSTPLQ